ncbi:MAG TPA: hypothetical protein VF221_08370, partial [Chloroflexota bacterium]
DLRAGGKPLLLLFASAGCGPCGAALSQAASWQAEHSSRLTVVPIIQGGTEAAQDKANALGLHNVLVEGADVTAVYEASMPSAVLVSPDGAIIGDVARGPDAIRELFEATIASGDEPLQGASTTAEPESGTHAEATNGHALPADLALLIPIKQSREYGAIGGGVTDPDLVDSWQEDGLHFFVFQLVATDHAETSSEPSTAVFVMRPEDAELVSAVVVAPGDEPDADVIDLRHPEQMDRLTTVEA